jgi:hypothetical protein
MRTSLIFLLLLGALTPLAFAQNQRYNGSGYAYFGWTGPEPVSSPTL